MQYHCQAAWALAISAGFHPEKMTIDLTERLVQVGDQITQRLDTDGQPD
jgi:hypothetical protein